jgi:dTDP-glucose 4,6-dehydratase
MLKILVTGGLGFIGSNFILHVLNNYPKIKIQNIDAEFHGSNKKNIPLKNNRFYQYTKGNINNQKMVFNLVEKCDAVINFAAESHVDRSITSPKPFIDSNVLGVFTILEAVKKFKKKLVQVSTDEVFGSLKSGSADEKVRFNPSSPYAASKAAAEVLINSYIVTYGCNISITRCTNNYGPRQFPEKLIPKVILFALENRKIPVYGTGKNIRDWIFVDDHCEGIMKVLLNGKQGESYNISANNEVDNMTIITKILNIMGKSKDLIQFVSDRPGHDYRYSLDSSKIRRELKWTPTHDFESGLNNTINWYIENKTWWKNLL